MPAFEDVVTDKNISAYFSYFFEDSCEGLQGLDANRVAFIFGLADFTWGLVGSVKNAGNEFKAPSGAELNKSTSMICSPGYLLRNADVVQNGTQSPTVSVSKNPSLYE